MNTKLTSLGHEQSEECCEHGHGQGHGRGRVHGHAHDSNALQRAYSPASPSQRSLVGSIKETVQWARAHDPVECEAMEHERETGKTGQCDHSQLNATTNVLVLVRANELITIAHMNTVLAIVSVFFLAVNLVCILLNAYDCNPKAPGCSPATTPIMFHTIEFGAAFVFNTVDVFALSYSPRTLSNQYQNPALLKLIVLFNVCVSLISFLLILINLQKFQVLAHELEYSNELTITLFNAVILVTLLRGRTHAENESFVFMIALLVAGCVAAAQLCVYNLSGWTAGGNPVGEHNSHYVEFAFGSMSACITFWFTMDNKLSAEVRLREIMYGSMLSSLEHEHRV